MATPSSSSSGLPLRSALKSDDQPDKGSPLATAAKAVSIADPDLVTLDEPQPRKQFTAGLGKKLNVRPQLSPRTNSQRSTSAQVAALEVLSDLPDAAVGEESPRLGQQHHHNHHRHRIDRATERLLAQVTEWIQHETRKASRRKVPRVSSRRREPEQGTTEGAMGSQQRSPSQDSASSQVSLDRLQRIVEDGMAALGLKTLPPLSPRLTARRHSTGRRRSSRSLQLQRTASSDTDFVDGDVLVPSSDAVIDNSGTLDRREEERRQAYVKFKDDIIRVAHTLKLKGWRRVPLDGGDSIEVERLSGALTNAVYVVSPPANLLAQPADGKRKPAKVLLRIYGPQVEHLIDRENELMVLQRLARKKIGPRLLGTFTNGRLEEFFNATTLTAADLRVPETSRQIAKRMRELHDGIDLLREERDSGPAVWKNWDSWVGKVELIAQHLDRQHAASLQANGSARGRDDMWQRRGFVCGVEWSRFRAMVDKSRDMVNEYYGDGRKLREKLVFAHNDTQYGNILRIRPDDERSPLLQPANEHKQLVVIDFEYAAANLPGLEFANHFTEWTYNYHDPVAPFACNTDRYPSVDQQRRFLKAYLEHVPQVGRNSNSTSTTSPNDTPLATPTAGTPVGTPGLHSSYSSSSIVEFMLDARVPPGGWKEEEKRQAEASERKLADLMEETRLWRIANSAQWVAWGIIQAKVPGLAAALTTRPEEEANTPPPASAGAAEVVTGTQRDDDELEHKDETQQGNAGGEHEFDYLAYAQERALFFWGDCVLMGLVKLEELPEGLQKSIKLVDR